MIRLARLALKLRKHRVAATGLAALAVIGSVPSGTPAGPSVDARVAEVMVIDARERDGTLSKRVLEGGKRYLITVTGSFSYGASGLRADAECAEGVGDPTFRSRRYINANGDDLLDVYLGTLSVDWKAENPDEQGCDPSHTYHYAIAPSRTGFLRLRVRDVASSDNQGTLTAVVFQTDCETMIGCVPPPPVPALPEIPTLPEMPPPPPLPEVPLPGGGEEPEPEPEPEPGPTLPELPPAPGVPEVPAPPTVEPPAVPPAPTIPELPLPPGGGEEPPKEEPEPGPSLPELPAPPAPPAVPPFPGIPPIPAPPEVPPAPEPGAPSGGGDRSAGIASSQLVESLNVDVASGTGITTRQPLRAGRLYTFVVSGVYTYDADGGVADAECSSTSTDPAYRHDRFGPTKLDLLANGFALEWKPTNPTEALCSGQHTYTYTVRAGSNTRLNFRIADDSYGDNNGALQVQVLNQEPSAIPNAGVVGPAGDLLDIVTVDSRDMFGSFTAVPLSAGANYLFVVQGTYWYGVGMADAECANLTQANSGTAPDPTYRDGRFPGELLDLTIGGAPVTWTPATTGNGACDPYNTYRAEVNAGPGGHALLRVLESSVAGYADNVGALQVSVYKL